MSGAAEVHVGATLTPSKMELLAGWLPRQPWFDGDPEQLSRAAFFRFVDPAGAVGLDCMVVTTSGDYYFVPVTWRSAPLDGGDLIGTLDHSELGLRYCYDAQTDPVFVAETTRVIREGDTQADIRDVHGDELPLTMTVQGAGVVAGEGGRLEIMRLLTRAAPTPEDVIGSLVSRWTDDAGPRHDVVAVLR